jgi:hypothetical protein
MVFPNYPPEKEKRVLELAKARQSEGWNIHQISQHYGVDRYWLADKIDDETLKKAPVPAAGHRRK